MPRMNGLEFLTAVKAHPEFARIPVVIITTEGTEDDTERGMQAGAAAYVKKPFRNEELLGVITAVARMGAAEFTYLNPPSSTAAARAAVHDIVKQMVKP